MAIEDAGVSAPAAPSAPPPSAPAESSAPSGAPEAFKGDRTDFLLRRAEAKATAAKVDVAKPDTASSLRPEPSTTQTEATATPEAQVAQPAQEAAPAPQIEARGKRNYGDLIKAVKDSQNIPETDRAEITGRLMREQNYVGLFPLREAQERRLVHDTLDAAKADREAAAYYNDLQGAFVSGDPRVAQEMEQTNPEAFAAFRRNVISNLHETDPEAFASVTYDGLRQVLSNVRQIQATASVDPASGERMFRGVLASDFEQAVNLIELALGWDTPTAAQEPQALPDHDPRLQRLAEYEQREQQQAQQAATAFHGAVMRGYGQKLLEVARQAIPQSAGYTEQARKVLANQIASKVFKMTVGSNNGEAMRLRSLAANGPHDPKTLNGILEGLMPKALVARDIALPEVLGAFNAMLGVNGNNGRSAPQPRADIPPGATAKSAPGAAPVYRGDRSAYLMEKAAWRGGKG